MNKTPESMIPRREDGESDKFESEPILVTTKMIKDFCELTGDIDEDTETSHLSEETAKDSFFGGVATPGAFTTALGIKSMREMNKKKNLFLGYEVLNLGSEATKYLKPIMAGDSISFHWEQKSRKDTKIKGRDAVICKWDVDVYNSKQEKSATINSWMFGYVKPKN